MENKNELGIYIHIPFCKQKCYYCDFISFVDKQEYIDKYIESLKRELDSYELNKYNITTIYVGGGTPSVIPSKNIKDLLYNIKEKIKENKTNWEDIEITLEVNPGTVDRKKLEEYKKAGVNRLSIGLQSANNKLLKEIGRIHTFEEFLKTYNIAKQVGFKNINMDLMIGLPNQTIEDVKQSLTQIIKLNPTHVSVYSLIVEENTKMEKMINSNKLKLPNEELERQMYWYVKNTLELNKYNHYEISNFSKKGKESKHNLNCWEQKEYIGLGVAAYSYLNNIRYGNTSSLEKYIEIKKFIDKKELEEEEIRIIDEIQNLDDRKKEYMLLGLRKIEGVSIQKFKEKYIDNPIFLFRKELEKLVNEKLLVIDGDNIKLTNKGLDFANIVWEEFV